MRERSSLLQRKLNLKSVTISAIAMFLSIGFAQSTAAEAPQAKSSRSYRPYPAIELTSLVFEKPRPLRAWTARIDLTSPEVELVTTPPAKSSPGFETESATTAEFATAENVQLAINATPFTPSRRKSGEETELTGLGACDGVIYSNPHNVYGALIVSAEGKAEIASPPINQKILSNVQNGVGGAHVLVSRGINKAYLAEADSHKHFSGPNPRTAVGLSADAKTMWFIVVDGRNQNRSEGMTLSELTEFGMSIGCHDLLNLDGGSSTTLVLQDPVTKNVREVNQPVGFRRPGTARPVGNNLGVRIKQKQNKK